MRSGAVINPEGVWSRCPKLCGAPNLTPSLTVADQGRWSFVNTPPSLDESRTDKVTKVAARRLSGQIQALSAVKYVSAT